METKAAPARIPTPWLGRKAVACGRLIEHTLDLIGNKWAPPIILALAHAAGPLRFTALKAAIPQITQKELTKRLRELEAVGLVDRKVYPVVPPKVEYRLTALGRSLRPVLDSLATWAARHAMVLAGNRAAHRARSDAAE
jgi:DNA-binding HxlR family transcriptional regulator